MPVNVGLERLYYLNIWAWQTLLFKYTIVQPTRSFIIFSTVDLKLFLEIIMSSYSCLYTLHHSNSKYLNVILVSTHKTVCES